MQSGERGQETANESPQARDARPAPDGGSRPPYWKIAVALALAAAIAVVLVLKETGDEPGLPADRQAAGRGADQNRPAPADRGAGQATAEQGAAETARSGGDAMDSSSETVLATVNGEDITLAEFERRLKELPEQVRNRVARPGHRYLESLIERKLLLQEARKSGTEAPAGGPQDEDSLLREFVQSRASGIEVTESDLKSFYDEHRDEIQGSPSFEEVREQLRPYVRQQKLQQAVRSLVEKLKNDAEITRNRDWIERSKAAAADNPLDRALETDRPVMADFGKGECIPCKMMLPMLKRLKEDYEGRAEILIIDIDEYPGLARRAEIFVLPTQVFYDADGREVSRHEGFMPQEDIEKRLEEMGVE